jgi:hypothetical protein
LPSHRDDPVLVPFAVDPDHSEIRVQIRHTELTQLGDP